MVQSTAKAEIRSQLNLIFATMKLLSAALDIDNASARDAVAATSESCEKHKFRLSVFTQHCCS